MPHILKIQPLLPTMQPPHILKIQPLRPTVAKILSKSIAIVTPMEGAVMKRR
jgi:hypothetical protein